MPHVLPVEARAALAAMLDAHRPELEARATDWVTQESVDLRGRRPREETADLVARAFSAWRAHLVDGDERPMMTFVLEVVELRGRQGFRLSTPQRGLLAFKKALRPRLDEQPGDIRLAILDGFDEAYEKVLFQLSDTYQEAYVQRQRELKEGAERAREAQTAFLAHVGHEIRAPLSSLVGLSQLLKSTSGQVGAEELAAYLSSMKDNAQHLLHLVDDLVELARLETADDPAQPEDLDLWRLARDVHRDSSDLAEARLVRYDLEIAADVPRYVRADGPKLARALRGVLQAALRCSPPEGAVRTRLDVFGDGTLRVRVDDEGVESLAHRRQWFEGLAQPPRVHNAGPGLAIAVAARLAARLGGALGVEGERDRFTWTLDAPLGELADVSTTADASVPIRSGPARVLVLTGPDTPASVLEEMLDGAHLASTFLPTAALDPATLAPAEILLVEHGGTPELVQRLLDAPALCGAAVLVATADDSHRERAALLAAGARAILDRPLDLDETLAALLDALALPALGTSA